MTVTTPAMTVQVREHDKVMEPYKLIAALRCWSCTLDDSSGMSAASVAEPGQFSQPPSRHRKMYPVCMFPRIAGTSASAVV
jgi:hypothetical protein